MATMDDGVWQHPVVIRAVEIARAQGCTATTLAGILCWRRVRPYLGRPEYIVLEEARRIAEAATHEARHEARYARLGAARCAAEGLWPRDASEALAAESDQASPAIQALAREIERTLPRSRSSWAGSAHSDIGLGEPYATLESSRAWSNNGKWSGTSSHLLLRVSYRALCALGTSGVCAEGLVHLDAVPALAEDRPGVRVYHADWVRGGRGISLVRERGYVAISPVCGQYHARTAAAARRGITARIRAAGIARHEAALYARLAEGRANDEGAVTVTPADSKSAGNCSAGTQAWIASHLPGREAATVAEVLATGDRSQHVLAACMAAIRRERKSK